MTRRSIPFSVRLPFQALALLSTLACPARAQVCFAGEIANSVDESPVGILHADLDGDGDQDLVTVNKYPGTVSVLLNHGDGSLAAEVRYLAGVRCTAVVSADLDGDGDVDLAVADNGSASVSILANHGDGTFAPAQHYATFFMPLSLTAADLDGDGAVDLVTLSENTSQLSVLLNQGAATFAPPAPCYLGTGTIVLSADMDGDGDIDLIVGGGDTVRVLANQGSGTFLVSWESSAIKDDFNLACADLDGDGDTDLVAAVDWGPVETLENLGGGTFAAPVECGFTGDQPSIVCGDLDNDGSLDLVVGAAVYTYRLQVLLNLGTGAFVPGEKPIAPTYRPRTTCADLDGDGDLDIALVGTYGRVCVLRNAGNASFPSEPGHTVGRNPDCVVSADLDGDGDADLAVTNGFIWDPHSGGVGVVANLGGGVLAPIVQYAVGMRPHILHSADMDGDGDADLIAIGVADPLTPTYGSVCVLLNQGNGTFVPQPPVGLPLGWPESATMADVDGDADVDLALTEGGRLRLLLNQGNGSLAPPVSYSLGGYASGVVSADLDGDGDIDLGVAVRDLLYSYSATRLVVLSNSGGGSFSVQVPHLRLPWGAREIVAADMDGDGDADLVSVSGSLGIFRNRGDATFESPIRTRLASQSYHPACMDVDGDGALDILLVGSGTDTVSVHLNLGDGSLAPAVEYGAAAALSNLTCADLDGDGRPELVTTSMLGTMHVLRNCSPQSPSFCAGDGSGAACPCSNNGASGHGCENSASTGGAVLAASGHAWLANDTLVLRSEGELASSVSVVLQGTLRTAPVGFGDGLRCVRGVLKRLYIRGAVGGVLTAPQPGDPSISVRSAALGDTISAGSTRLYQVYYRDPDLGFCPAPQGNSWNVSSGVAVRWLQ